MIVFHLDNSVSGYLVRGNKDIVGALDAASLDSRGRLRGQSVGLAGISVSPVRDQTFFMFRNCLRGNCIYIFTDVDAFLYAEVIDLCI